MKNNFLRACGFILKFDISLAPRALVEDYLFAKCACVAICVMCIIGTAATNDVNESRA